LDPTYRPQSRAASHPAGRQPEAARAAPYNIDGPRIAQDQVLGKAQPADIAASPLPRDSAAVNAPAVQDVRFTPPPQADRMGPQRRSAADATTIEVRIGRIEIKADAPISAPRQQTATEAAILPLDDYLHQRTTET
jgi:hypothetical protein